MTTITGNTFRLAAPFWRNRPDILFMDESSTALDNATEAHRYQLIVERLTDCTVVGVAHRSTLEVFHDRQLQVAAPAA